MIPSQSQLLQSEPVLMNLIFDFKNSYIVLVGVNHTTNNKAETNQKATFWYNGMNFVGEVKCNFCNT